MNGQYIIPTSEITSGPEVRSFEDVKTDSSPERPNGSYAYYKDIENGIKKLRENATEETLPRSVKTKVMELFTSTPRPLVDRLIEQESVIGGEIFQRSSSVLRQRFWYHENDWFFEQSFLVPQGEAQVVLHYQINENSIDKYYGGRKYSVDDVEAEKLFGAIEKYHQNVQHKLYGK